MLFLFIKKCFENCLSVTLIDLAFFAWRHQIASYYFSIYNKHDCFKPTKNESTLNKYGGPNSVCLNNHPQFHQYDKPQQKYKILRHKNT